MKRGAIPLLTVLFLVMAAAVPGSCGTAPPMIEKNLFSQDRKPPSPESAAAPPPTNKPAVSPKAFQLDGIIIHGDTRKALVRMKTGGGPVGQKGKSQSPYIVVTEGGLLADYRVTKIDVKSISLEKDGQTIVVTLFAEGKTSPPVPAAPAPFNPAPDGQAVPERGRGHGGPLRGGRPEPGRPGGPPGDNVHAGEAAAPGVAQQAGQQENAPGEENAVEEEAQPSEETVDESGP